VSQQPSPTRTAPNNGGHEFRAQRWRHWWHVRRHVCLASPADWAVLAGSSPPTPMSKDPCFALKLTCNHHHWQCCWHHRPLQHHLHHYCKCLNVEGSSRQVGLLHFHSCIGTKCCIFTLSLPFISLLVLLSFPSSPSGSTSKARQPVHKEREREGGGRN